MYSDERYQNKFKRLLHDACEAEELIPLDELDSYRPRRLVSKDWISGSNDQVKEPDSE